MNQKVSEQDSQLIGSDLCEYYHSEIRDRINDNDYNTPLVIFLEDIRNYGYPSKPEFEVDIILPIITSLAIECDEDFESLSRKLFGCIKYV